MDRMQVWAADRKSVELVIANDAWPMEQMGADWWTIEFPERDTDVDYFFRLDRSDTLPDPRSKFQPQGVFGPSRLVNLDEFTWHDHAFQARPLSAAVIYEMHVGTFTSKGTFEAAIDKLQHLSRLGVTHLELMPVAEFAGKRGWGYDGVFPYAPHHTYGGPDGLARLVDACHQEGIGVILDVVYNHLGPAGNHLAQFGPYFTDRHRTPWGSAINFDAAYSDEVRRFFVDNATMWLRDYHFDGLRLDAIHAILPHSHSLNNWRKKSKPLRPTWGATSC